MTDPFHAILPERRLARLKESTYNSGVRWTGVLQIPNYGGIVTSLQTPDRQGTITDIVLGFDSLDGYLANPGPFFGALIGRYANRIGHARFALTRVPYQLDKNDGENTLHGGPRGFDKRAWTARALPDGGRSRW